MELPLTIRALAGSFFSVRRVDHRTNGHRIFRPGVSEVRSSVARAGSPDGLNRWLHCRKLIGGPNIAHAYESPLMFGEKKNTRSHFYGAL